MSKQDMKIFSILAILIVAFVAIGAVSAAEVGTGTADITVDGDLSDSTTPTAVVTGDNVSSTKISIIDNVATPSNDDYVIINDTSYNSAGVSSVSHVVNNTKANATVYSFNTTSNKYDVLVGYLADNTTDANGVAGFNLSSMIWADENGAWVNGTNYGICFNVSQLVGIEQTVTGSYNTLNTTANWGYFTYLSNALVNVENVTSNYNSDWTIAGTLTDANGTPIDGNGFTVADFNVTITNSSGDKLKTEQALSVGSDGRFSFNQNFLNTLPVGLYNITFQYKGNAYIPATNYTSTLNITKKSGVLDVKLNATTINFGDDVSLNGTVLDSDDKVLNNPNIVYNIVGTSYTGVAVTVKGNGTIAQAIANANSLDAGKYAIFVYNANGNYTIDSVALTLTVIPVQAVIAANDTVATTSDDVIVNVNNTVTPTSNGYSWTLTDKNGYVISKSSTADAPLNLGKLVAGEYTLTITYTDAKAPNVLGQTITVNVTVKGDDMVSVYDNANKTVSVVNLTYPVNSSNATKLNINVTGKDGAKLNGTVFVLLNNLTVDTITVVNGTAAYDLTSLKFTAGKNLNVSFLFIGTEDYISNITNIIVNVKGLDGYLNINTSSVVLNLTNNPTVTLNLTSDKNGKNLTNFTGTVIVKDSEGYIVDAIDMVNGTAVFDAKDLALFANDTFTFQAENYDGTVTLKVNITTVDPVVDTMDNVSATADSVVVTVPMNNTEEGALVIGYLFDNNGKRLTAVFGTIVNGSATFDFGAQATGNYTMQMDYMGLIYTTDLEFANVTNITVTAAPSVNATVITADNMTLAPSSGVNFTAVLKDANGNVIIGKEVQLTLFNALGESKVYWATTNTNGEAKLPINLAYNGTYTIECYYPGDNTTPASNKYNATVVIGNVTPVTNATIMTASDLNTTNRSGVNYTAKLTYANGTAVSGAEVKLVLKNALNQTVTYDRTTNANGEAKLPIELAYPATYTIECYYDGSASIPASNHSTGTIIITALA